MLVGMLIGTGIWYLALPNSSLRPAQATTYINTPGASNTDTCNRVRLSISETPSCPRLTQDTGVACVVSSGGTNNTSSYTMRVNIRSEDGNPHTVTYLGATNFCRGGYLQSSLSYCACVNNEENTGLVNLNIPANGTQTVTLSRTSPYGACGSYQFDFGVYSVDGNTSCNFRNQNGEFTGITAGCETGTTCTAAPVTYTVSGGVFIDNNKNGVKDGSEQYYLGTGAFSTSPGNMAASPFGTYILSGPTSGTDVTVSFVPPAGYRVINPLNGPPPSWQVRVGAGCTTGGAPGASCVGGNIQNLNFAISDSVPWMQIYGLDARFDNGYTSSVPQAPEYPRYAAVKDTSSNMPGIIYTGNVNADLGNGQASTRDWVVGGTTYPEVYTPQGTQTETSYQYLLDKATKAGVTRTNMTTLIGCSALNNCTLPANLPSGVYVANGDVRLNAFTAPVDRDYVFLIDGSLTVAGRIVVPNGSVAFFSASRDITIDRTVAATANTSPLPAGQVQGLFSADRNFIVGGTTNCATAVDRMFNMEGAIVVNAGNAGGTFTNNRDLCGDNSDFPAFTVRSRLDFILNSPTFLMKQNTTFREEAP